MGWKAMEPSPDKGFPDRLSADAVKEGLKTEWLGQKSVFYFDVLESTNTEANRLAREGAPEGTLVISDAQTKGRGRLKRSWVSPPGTGIYVSIVLRPECPADRFPALTLTASVAVASALQEMGVMPQLKWPNDVLIGGRKVGGILTEAVFDKKLGAFAVLGIGVNVNTTRDAFPAPVRTLATSLRVSLDKAVSRIHVVQSLLRQLERWYDAFCSAGSEPILKAWSEFDTTLGNAVEVGLPGKKLLGVAEALEPDGTLLVRDKTNRLHRIVAGDVVHCRVDPFTVHRSP